MAAARGRVLGAALTLVAVASVSCSSGGRPRTTTTSTGRAATSSSSTTSPTGSSPGAGKPSSTAVSRGHVVVVMMENRSYSDVIGSRSAPYLNSLAQHGTSFTAMHAITHPSQPNYLALFSGSTHGVTGDACPQHLTGGTLAGELRTARLGFAGYSEGLPSRGSRTCAAGRYARKHAPWTDFASLPASTDQPFTAFPTNFATLPTVSFVIPDLDHDMHDGTVADADTWTRQHLARYATWAVSHHSLLVITWDEDDHSQGNRIPTIVVGADVHARRVGTRVTLYSLLRALEDRYRLPRLGAAASAPSLGLP